MHFAWLAWHLATSTLHFARPAWHLATSTSTLRGRRGTSWEAIFHTQLYHIPSSHTTFFQHTHTLNFLTHHLSHTHTYTSLSHTTLSHAAFVIHHHLCHKPSFTHIIVPHHSCHTQLSPYKCLTYRSSTISFVCPSLPIPLELLFLLIGKKLTCGVIRSFF